MIVNRRSRVVNREHLETARLLQRAVQTRDAHVGFQYELRGEVAQRHDELGVNRARLLAQIRRADFDLLRARVAVSRWAALQHVRDEDVLAIQTRDFEQRVQVLPRFPHEGNAL